LETKGLRKKLIAFICSHCSLSGADSAGVKGLQYPPDVRVVRLTCSGQVNEILILEALRSGADGVIIFGCPDNDCHYKVGSKIAKRRVEKLRGMLPALGIDAERVRFVQVAASEGEKFAEAISEMAEKIEELGPNPLRGG